MGGKGSGRPRGIQIIKVCPVCGKSFPVPPSLMRIEHCSRECYLKSEKHKKLMTKLHTDSIIQKKKSERLKLFHREHPEIAKKAGKKGYAKALEKYPDFHERGMRGSKLWRKKTQSL